MVSRPYHTNRESFDNRAEISSSFQTSAILFLLMHVPFAVALKSSSTLASVHALGMLLIGLFLVANDKEPDRLIYLTAYMVGAEPLWRLAHAAVFWEYDKYSVSLLLILAMLKNNRVSRADKRIMLYFLLLIPSIIVLPEFDRKSISFNMSGPLALAVATMFFTTISLKRPQIAKLFIALLAPIIGAAFLATSGTLQYEHIALSGSSKITSAGYGPNQMSSMLGLGGLIAILYALIYREHKRLKKLMILILIWLGTQSALTFSRGGVWTMFGGMTVIVFYLIRDRRHRQSIFLGGTLLLLVSSYVLLPMLNDFTKGTLGKRFQDFDATGREDIVRADLAIFKDNLLFGIGPGESRRVHKLMLGSPKAAHTEYSRLLAEHGSFGMAALFVMIVIAYKRAKAKTHPVEKASTVALTAWAVLFLFHAAIRLCAPCFVFGLGGSNLLIITETKSS
jgi:hypothetical protein